MGTLTRRRLAASEYDTATASARPAASGTGTTEVWYASATIIGPDAGLADALATAALVAGPSAAAWFAGLPDWSVYLIKDGQASYFGPAFSC